MSDEIVESICIGLLGAALYLRLLWMFGTAAWRGVFVFRLGEIHDKPARVIGVIGLLGLASFAYLAVGTFLERQLPLWFVAGFFLALAVLMVLGVSIFGLLRLFGVILRILWKLAFK